MSHSPRRFSYVASTGVVLVAGIALLFAFVVLQEAAQVALGGPSVRAEYHFGSESMVAHGGWPYRSATTYVAVGLIEGFVLAGAALVALWSLWRGRASVAARAAVVILLTLAWTFLSPL